MIPVQRLPSADVRAALRLAGDADPPSHRGTATRRLRAQLSAPGAVRALLDAAPDGARAAFVTLCEQGPATVETLLARGWWGRGTLPPPLDWLQRRALIAVADDGLVHAVTEAAEAFAERTLDLALPARRAAPVRLEAAATVLLAPDDTSLAACVAVAAAQLRAVAPTVAVSDRTPETVEAALRAAGVRVDVDLDPGDEPAARTLPGDGEDAYGPRAIRMLLSRAVAEQRQVQLRYFASSRGGVPTERTVDPWRFGDDLLVGYCHLRGGERTFAVDRIGVARLLTSPVAEPDPS